MANERTETENAQMGSLNGARVMTLNGPGTVVGRIIERGVVTRILVQHEWIGTSIPNAFAYPAQFVWPLETNLEAQNATR